MKRSLKADSLLLSAALIWGGTFLVVKWSLREVSPFLFLTIRFSLASLALLVFLPSSGRTLKRTTLYKGGILGVFLFLGFALQTVGLKYTTASKSAFITGCTVGFVPLVNFLLYKKLPKPSPLLGVALSLVGVWLLTRPAGVGFNVGDLATLLCAVSFAFQISLVQVYTSVDNWLKLLLVQFLTASLLSFILFLGLERGGPSLSLGLIWAFLYTSLLATDLAILIQFRYQKETTPTRAGVIYTFELVFAALLAKTFWGESWGYGGGALILAGIIVMELGRKVGWRKDKPGG